MGGAVPLHQREVRPPGFPDRQLGLSLGLNPLLAIGGHTSVADSTSYGSYLLNTASTLGIGGNGFSTGNDRFDILNADTVVFPVSEPGMVCPRHPDDELPARKGKGR